MALPSLPPRLVLGACTGLLLLGGIAGAATVDPDDEEAAPTEQLVPNDTAAAPGPGVAGDAGGAAEALAAVPAGPGAVTTSTTAAPARPAAGGATTTTRSTARPARAAPPGPLVAPKPGSYGYDATTTSASGSRTNRTTTTVEAAGTEGRSTLQTITIPLELGGQQATARNTVAWGPGGAVVRRSLITVAAFGQLDCGWQPAFAQYAGGLAVGKTWSFDTRCTGQLQGLEVTIQQRATRKVTGTTRAAGPTGPLATWTIADDTTVVVTSPLGVTTVRSVGTQQLAPSIGAPVRTEARVESTTAGSAPQQATVSTRLVTQP